MEFVLLRDPMLLLRLGDVWLRASSTLFHVLRTNGGGGGKLIIPRNRSASISMNSIPPHQSSLWSVILLFISWPVVAMLSWIRGPLFTPYWFLWSRLLLLKPLSLHKVVGLCFYCSPRSRSASWFCCECQNEALTPTAGVHRPITQCSTSTCYITQCSHV